MKLENPEAILVFANTMRDATVVCEELARYGIRGQIVGEIEELCGAIVSGAGGAVISEDRLIPGNERALFRVLRRQPPWSDFPVIILASRKRRRETAGQLERLGNVTILQPPLRIRTLASAARSAVRSRRRQYHARSAIEERDRFMAMLGHELRNPLSAISLALEVNDPSGRRNGQILRRQTAQLTRLVDDLLDVARVTNGKIELRREDADLEQAIGRNVSAVQRRFDEDHIQLDVELTGELIASVDPARFDQILGNLLINAAKYTPAGGRVEVRLAWDDVDRHAVIYVQDNGIGIEPAMLDRVFEQFVQLDTGLARSDGGMGIGLTLVRTLVELHGGTVQAESPGIGQGSRFTVRLPARRAGARDNQREVLLGGVQKSPRPRRIVVVEDNQDSRELLVLLLESMGHEVRSAADGKAGLNLMMWELPDAALVDIGLPELDGYEVARQLRKAGGHDVFLVAVSGYGQPADRQRAFEAGFDEHLTKPPRVERLSQLLDSLGAETSSRAQTSPGTEREITTDPSFRL